MITIDLARYFTTCFELGSYSQASRKLSKSRVTVREQMMVLEDLVGKTLFEVQGKSLKASEYALAIYPHMKHLVEQSESLDAVALSLFDVELTKVNVNFDNFLPYAAIRVVNKAVSELYPNVRINWQVDKRETSLEAVERRYIHIAIYPHRQKAYPFKQVSYRRLGDIPVGAYAAVDSDLAKSNQVSLKSLRKRKQYMTENMLDEGLSIYWISNERHCISTNELLISLLEVDGFAMLPNWVAHPFVQQGILKKLVVTEVIEDYRQGLTLHFPVSLENNPIIQTIIGLFNEQLSSFSDRHS